jgi:hypothetical protein
MIYRILYNTHSMNVDTDYIEIAQLLDDAAPPRRHALRRLTPKEFRRSRWNFYSF